MPSVGLRAESEPRDYEPGSREDFDRLYRDSYPNIYRTMIGVLGDPAAAEDCAQDAFVQAFRAWGRWRPDAPAEAWLHRIAINTAVSYQRKANLRTIGSILRRLGRPGAGPDPAQVALDKELTAALRRLAPKLRAALVLRHFHGYTNREIAAATGISERTVNKRLHKAAERMRALLSGDADVFPLRDPGSLSSTTDRVDRQEPPMTNKTGREFDQRLRAALNRSLPPTPRPERARYSRALGGTQSMLGFKVALAAGCAVALTIGVSAITGSADPAVWTQRAVTTVQSVTQPHEASPTPETEHPQQPAETMPTAQPAATKTENPGRESPDPSEDRHRESEPPEASGARTHPPDESPNGRPDGGYPGTPGRDN